MSGGDIAGLIAAGVFLILVLLLAVPLLKLGGVLDEVRSGIRESVDAITPTLAETQVTVLEANKQLAKIDSITTHVSETTSNVSSLVALTAATVGGPLIKLAGFSAAVRAGISSLKSDGPATVKSASKPKKPKPRATR
ncbi:MULTISPECIES: DUF948 domain-containing protein [Pseudoclavibacter]|uniref:DUF948 domain-containing protein n=1 Tax=Pseudoclavibacter terrae TaxID=1530195 RepID=A0A7J5B5Q9_9MICO|nr:MULTISPECIES: DUF948 domain-containing protein [Pseudoclavibacter]KAB1638474.1 DUF948 domain-containing protein [Pseudoclavibacter terrae]PPG39176.1 DUF948 domain-containing protein [Pseudoclavibacter sp. RFBA6]